MKFLITVATYYPLADGVQMVTQYTAEELVRLGHEVTIITSTLKREEFPEMHNGVKLIYTDVYKLHGIIKGDKKKYTKLVLQEVADKDVMINVSLQTPTTDILCPVLDRIKCKKILYLHDIHDFEWHKDDFGNIKSTLSKMYYNVLYGLYYSIAHKYMRKYNLITHLSPFDSSIRYVKKHSISQNVIIGNAALDDVFKKEKGNSPCQMSYFLCLANYALHKNQMYVLNAFYKTENKDCKMVFIGRYANDYYHKFITEKKRLDTKFGIRQVEFKVGLSREETSRYIANAKSIILGSLIEKFPIVLVESMASKIPFISTDVGSVRYMPGGFIIHSQTEMAYWMDYILTNQKSAELIGEAGYVYATENMTVQSKVASLIKAINNIIL